MNHMIFFVLYGVESIWDMDESRGRCSNRNV